MNTSALIYDGDAIVEKFGGRRVGYKGWRFCCPAHNDRGQAYYQKASAFMSTNGALYCHFGCSPEAIAAALDAAGIKATTAKPVSHASFRQQRQAEILKAQSLWADAPNAAHDLEVVAGYLRYQRNITLPVPNALRRWGTNAYIAAVRQLNGTLTAVHIRSAIGERRSPGWLGKGAVQLAAPIDGQLALAEGIEDALSVAELTNLPCWAALGAKRLHQIAIPPDVEVLHLFGDDDDAGREALDRAARRYLKLGLTVSKHLPPTGFKDFNDMLKAQVQS